MLRQTALNVREQCTGIHDFVSQPIQFARCICMVSDGCAHHPLMRRCWHKTFVHLWLDTEQRSLAQPSS